MHPIVSVTSAEDPRPAIRSGRLPASGALSAAGASYEAERCAALLDRALAATGADAARAGTPDWNPLGEWIGLGEQVFILPNLVAHRRHDETPEAFLAKCTPGAVLRPVLEHVLRAVGDPAKVRFGNAPLQACDYGRVAADTGIAALREEFLQRTGADLGPVDLRQLTSRWSRYGAKLATDLPAGEDAVHIDLGSDSWLEPLFESASAPAQVRVGDYDPAETMAFHARGRHVYAINRRILEADVLVSVPKLKTHQKVGITCALKGMVGTVSRKECLAHHRKGGPGQGGDEFPHGTPLHRLGSELADRAAARGTALLDNAFRLGSKLLYRTLRIGPGMVNNGSWHGNDTAWRMVLDIARILRYARPDGTLCATEQRRHLVIVDGIVAGEGEGPLRPRPVQAGVLVFGTDPVWTDIACATLMGFDPARIPMLRHALVGSRQPLTDEPAAAGVRWFLNGRPAALHDIEDHFGYRFLPPKGWVGHMEASTPALR
jgi:hypothetical protein